VIPRTVATVLVLLLAACGASHPTGPGSAVTTGAVGTGPTAPSSTARSSTVAPTTTAAADPADALQAYLSAHPEAVPNSGVVHDGPTPMAVVGLQRGSHDHAVEVLDLASGTARTVADLVLPPPSFDFAPLPMTVADVTGDGHPDFLVRVMAGDDEPGVVVSADGGPWRLVPATTGSPPVTNVYVGREPSFSGGRFVSTHDDCTPDCAAGRLTTITWLYQRDQAAFTSS